MQVKDLLRTLQLVDPELTVYTTERDYQLESPNAVAIDLTHKQLIIGQTSYWTPDKKYDTVIYSEES